MLAADKLYLASSFQRNAVELKEKELKLHYDNFMAISTQAAVLIGFAVGAIIELDMPPNAPAIFQFAFYVSTIVSLVANFQCISCTTIVSVYGSQLSLRGPEGSVQIATENMFKERHNIFRLFAIGVISLHFAVLFASVLKMRLEAAVASVSIIMYSLYSLLTHMKAVHAKFYYSELDTPTLEDILMGPALSNALSKRKLRLEKQADRKTGWADWAGRNIWRKPDSPEIVVV
mmetsp:Transcript_9654/g.16578  ORF Transcript_9654/g.16578 Transcript_9654/m.16578 type:complete len:232 (+) Transcript_9654:544-1239(+)|eukprot:CAMPEP_0198208912 /NCGR_PEP_ID=MMETSP1445-20131203/12251_1 /TAXON_ID=36898 /ORGANISM="Pyramimonas sp., Strain CCMP2087" /LENGTH=231 /DNA_ID=CAMNT_0043882497 /DNA_START=522 /DNA_END=1217 /DNA_ORIENTATION=+